jgi:hypothetical protein
MPILVAEEGRLDLSSKRLGTSVSYQLLVKPFPMPLLGPWWLGGGQALSLVIRRGAINGTNQQSFFSAWFRS